MYNFLVTAQDDAWNKQGYEYERGRFMEYTSEDIADRFQKLEQAHIDILLSLPCLFAYEGKTKSLRVGNLTKIRAREHSLYIEFELDRTVQPIPFKKIEPLRAALDIRDWELNRTHWAIKDEDLFDVLARTKLISIRPKSRLIDKANLPAPPEPNAPIKSVGAFIEKVLGLNDPPKEVFYRGHSNRSKYRLEPSLFRKDDRGNFKHLDSEDRMFRELLVSNSVDFQEDIYTLDKLVRMQHYSLPTRLLDITSNPLIALFFACISNPKEVGEVIVFKMDREQIKYFDSDTASSIANLTRLTKSEKESIDYKIADTGRFNRQTAVKQLVHFVKQEKPYFEERIDPKHLRSILCVKGKHTNSRISFQSGAFLLFGQDAALDENGTPEIGVERIPVADKPQVLTQLDQLNINARTVFPYIENSAKYIAEKFSFRL